jgi:hypothetical protein
VEAVKTRLKQLKDFFIFNLRFRHARRLLGKIYPRIAQIYADNSRVRQRSWRCQLRWRDHSTPLYPLNPRMIFNLTRICFNDNIIT